MSLEIDLDDVTAVLLADGWHKVFEKSFVLDAYEFVWAKGGKNDSLRNISPCHTGFQFREFYQVLDSYSEGGRRSVDLTIAGPLSSIIAIQRERK